MENLKNNEGNINELMKFKDLPDRDVLAKIEEINNRLALLTNPENIEISEFSESENDIEAELKIKNEEIKRLEHDLAILKGEASRRSFLN